MDRAALPTHFIVYREWMGIDPLLGEELTHRYVNATILGGTTMTANRADYATLGSGEAPAVNRGKSLDCLDVADLESEASHAYELFWATQNDCVVFEGFRETNRADGGRRSRTLDRFALELVGKGVLLGRFVSEEPIELRVRVDGQDVGKLSLAASTWDEASLDFPEDLASGRHVVEVAPPAGKSFASLHYWSFPPGNTPSARKP